MLETSAGGDSVTNDRGRQFKKWESDFEVPYGFKIYPPALPTFPKSGSRLDYCIADNRIEITNSPNEKIPVLEYDSDHNALLLCINTNTLFDGLAAPMERSVKYNYKKANWEKFKRHMNKQYKEEEQVPANRNLTITEIDEHIIKLENLITTCINDIIPRIDPNKWKYYEKYESNAIKKLHNYKSFLLSRLHFTRYKSPAAHSKQEITRIKTTIRLINKKLAKEFKRTITAYWKALIKSINYRDSHQFFPLINRLLRPNKAIKLSNFKFDVNSSAFSKNLSETHPHLISNNEIIITDPLTKLEVIGSYLESINSPRYTNMDSDNKIMADSSTDILSSTRAKIRHSNLTFTEFTEENSAYNPSQDRDNGNGPKCFFSQYEIQIILKMLKNKTSSGLDNIPAIALKHIPDSVIRSYTIIFNNAINQAYYPRQPLKSPRAYNKEL
ncbi:uncharacterized protein [Chelonus insularis]|uniref:uncharacterized protein n=1 Tax=Chelonus insularis TaxID=460826 RepID=UPI001589527D|nr:uncharacterized protein LOC118073422 [Chelonus insularis]